MSKSIKDELRNRLENGSEPRKVIQEYFDSLYLEVLERFRHSKDYGDLRYHQGDLNRVIELKELFKVV